jgi:hypothetical protein
VKVTELPAPNVVAPPGTKKPLWTESGAKGAEAALVGVNVNAVDAGPCLPPPRAPAVAATAYEYVVPGTALESVYVVAGGVPAVGVIVVRAVYVPMLPLVTTARYTV